MPYRIPFGKTFIECDTPEEAMRLTRSLDTDAGEFPPGNVMRHHGPWTEQLLDTFLHSLGPDQKKILSVLVARSRASAEELRKAVNVDTNQSLAGIMSGISKQATRLKVAPRDVFGIENRRRSGVLSKSFFIAQEFQAMAVFAGWPNPTENKP